MAARKVTRRSEKGRTPIGAPKNRKATAGSIKQWLVPAFNWALLLPPFDVKQDDVVRLLFQRVDNQHADEQRSHRRRDTGWQSTLKFLRDAQAPHESELREVPIEESLIEVIIRSPLDIGPTEMPKEVADVFGSRPGHQVLAAQARMMAGYFARFAELFEALERGEPKWPAQGDGRVDELLPGGNALEHQERATAAVEQVWKYLFVGDSPLMYALFLVDWHSRSITNMVTSILDETKRRRIPGRVAADPKILEPKLRKWVAASSTRKIMTQFAVFPNERAALANHANLITEALLAWNRHGRPKSGSLTEPRGKWELAADIAEAMGLTHIGVSSFLVRLGSPVFQALTWPTRAF